MSNLKILRTPSTSTTTITVTVTGENGNAGFSNLTIPKNAIESGETPTVSIDEKLIQSQG